MIVPGGQCELLVQEVAADHESLVIFASPQRAHATARLYHTSTGERPKKGRLQNRAMSLAINIVLFAAQHLNLFQLTYVLSEALRSPSLKSDTIWSAADFLNRAHHCLKHLSCLQLFGRLHLPSCGSGPTCLFRQGVGIEAMQYVCEPSSPPVYVC